MENKISVKVSPTKRNKLMTDGKKIFLDNHPERASTPPTFDELFGYAVDIYCEGYVIDPKWIEFFKKFAPELFEERNATKE